MRRHGGMLLLLAMLASACGTDVEPAAGATVRVQGCEPASLVPHLSVQACEGPVIRTLFTPLVRVERPEGTVVPVAAGSVTSEDLTTWTIRLRPGWRFHDGTPVTAADFVDAWSWTADPANGSLHGGEMAGIVGAGDTTAAGGRLPGLRVEDELTFTVELVGPDATFPYRLELAPFAPLPRAFFVDREAFTAAPVGNGPMRLESWQPDTGLTLARFEEYAGPAALPDRVEWRVHASDRSAYLALLDDELDIANLPLSELATTRRERPEQLKVAARGRLDFLLFPLYDARFAPVGVRRAVSLALDRDAVNTGIYGGTRTPATGLVPPEMPGHRVDACSSCRRDPAAARAALADAGGWGGPLRLYHRQDAPGTSTTGDEAVAIANQLREGLGIDVELVSLTQADLVGHLFGRTLDGIALMGFGTGPAAPQWFFQRLFDTAGSFNLAGYSNPEVDRLLGQAGAAPSLADALPSIAAAEDVLLRDLPVVPTFFGTAWYLTSDRVIDLPLDADGMPVLARVAARG